MRYPAPLFALLPFLSPVSILAQTAAATGATLDGDVIDAVTGTPIAGARVKLAPPGQAEPLYLKSDSAGHFHFRNLSPALYDLRVETPGYLQPPQPVFLDLAVPQPGPGWRVGYPRATGTTFDTARGPDGSLHATISVRLTAYAVITGKVTDPDGMPLEDWSIQLLARQPGQATGARDDLIPKTTVHTNDRGEYRAARLEPGDYYILANKPGFPAIVESTYRATYYPHSIDLKSAKALDLAAGGRARADIRIASQAGIRIAGRLVKPAVAEDPGKPLTYTSVALMPEPNPLTGWNGPTTAATDDYVFNDILPGKYTLLAVTREISMDLLAGVQKPVFGLMRTIQAGDTDMDGVDLVLLPVRDLTGAVTFPDGCTPLPVTIRLDSMSPVSTGPVEAVSGADGNFAFRGMGAGKYTVSVSSKNQIARVTSMRLGDRNVEKDGFEAPLQGDDPLLIDVSCDSAGRPR